MTKQTNIDDPIENFVPHRKPMLLVDKLIYAQENTIEATYTVTKDCIFLKENKEVEAVALIEILAQCFAAGNGLTKPKAFGFLASMRNIKIYGKAYLNDTLSAKVQLSTTVGDIMVVEGKLYNKDQCIIEGQFKIFVPGEAA